MCIKEVLQKEARGAARNSEKDQGAVLPGWGSQTKL